MLKENPKSETIQAVTVVPIFAPNIIPIACVKLKTWAFTKEITITVVAPLDWITAVTKSPVNTAVIRFPEIILNR